jgi:diaminohydroxyphosphoribosylaminopyrimidine deaminase/5-amino-6-(5-phosphoribosylamino)uracil reductase
VTLKLALSLDAAIAGPGRTPLWLTGPETRREVHRLRAGADAIAVGRGTLLADDPMLTVRDAPAPRVAPARVVFARTAALPPASRLVRTARETRTIVVAEQPDAERVARLTREGVDVVTAAGLEEGLVALRERGVRSLLVEGGATLAGALLDAGLVDRLIIFQAPLVLGAGALNAFSAVAPRGDPRRLEVLERREFGADLKTVYAISRESCSPA